MYYYYTHKQQAMLGQQNTTVKTQAKKYRPSSYRKLESSIDGPQKTYTHTRNEKRHTIDQLPRPECAFRLQTTACDDAANKLRPDRDDCAAPYEFGY